MVLGESGWLSKEHWWVHKECLRAPTDTENACRSNLNTLGRFYCFEILEQNLATWWWKRPTEGLQMILMWDCPCRQEAHAVFRRKSPSHTQLCEHPVSLMKKPNFGVSWPVHKETVNDFHEHLFALHWVLYLFVVFGCKIEKESFLAKGFF